MEGRAKYLTQLIEGSSKRFHIPVYQRNYEWSELQCRQLFNDLEDLINKNRQNHFFGSIVSLAKGKDHFQIIDGQQRITTISLLILAMYSLLASKKLESKEESLKDRLLHEYLIDRYQTGDLRIKLRLTENNHIYYSKLFVDPEFRVQGSRIIENFQYFRNRILHSKHSIDQIFDAFGKLVIIDLIIDEKDEPQKVFESINATGLDLSEADKIRNYLLMDLDQDTQAEYYGKYWSKIESNCHKNSVKVSMFIRDYLTVKTSE